ncbi:hypothetical protein OHR68_03315 [Spirillospora sp. NBC_00431]
MARRSPQEKKRISYAKDSRNAFAENDKSSRNAVRLNKRFPNRANRHRVQQILLDATGSPDHETANDVDERLARKRPKKWRKEPGLPLGDWVESRLQRRVRLDDNGKDETTGEGEGDGESRANERRLARVQQRRRRRAKLRTLKKAHVATKGIVERRW